METLFLEIPLNWTELIQYSLPNPKEHDQYLA